MVQNRGGREGGREEGRKEVKKERRKARVDIVFGDHNKAQWRWREGRLERTRGAILFHVKCQHFIMVSKYTLSIATMDPSSAFTQQQKKKKEKGGSKVVCEHVLNKHPMQVWKHTRA